MKKALLFLALFALLGLTSAWAYDFSAVAPSGQTLYYTIISSTSHTVQVVPPNSSSPYWNTPPTGSLTIPSSVTYSGMTYSVTAIGNSAFSSCSGLTSVTIPNSVTYIGYSAFWGCSGLTSVTIPNSVTAIGNSAFRNCSSLTSVTIPNSVTAIGDFAFYDCSSLTTVTIPNSVTYIGESAFCRVRNIIYHGTASGSPWKALTVNSYEEGDLFYSDNTKTHLTGCRSTATTVTIPNSVTSIGYSAFRNCSGLTSVTIPNTVTSIGDFAFYDCSGLTRVTIPNSVTAIGGYAFYYCSGLTSVTIPNSVTSIGRFAFSECRRLTSVTIPNSVTAIGDHAFSGCRRLTSVTVPSFFFKKKKIFPPTARIKYYDPNNPTTTGSFDSIWIEDNVSDAYGEKGMKIHVKFQIDGMQNIQGEVAAVFCDSDSTPLNDKNGKYASGSGKVAAYKDFTPPYKSYIYNDLTIFMPYSELHLDKTTSGYFLLSILNGKNTVAYSDYQKFTYTYQAPAPTNYSSTSSSSKSSGYNPSTSYSSSYSSSKTRRHTSFSSWDNVPHHYFDMAVATDFSADLLGIVYDYVPSHIGFHSSIYFNEGGINSALGLLWNPTDDDNLLQWHLYAGCGYSTFTKKILYEGGMRFSFSERNTNIAKYDLTIGAQFTDGYYLFTAGMGIYLTGIIGLTLLCGYGIYAGYGYNYYY